MASLVAETSRYINGDQDNSNGIMEISEFNGALLMSLLLEESYCDEYNDEQVNRVIQSLEAEMSGNMIQPVHEISAMEPANQFLSDDDDKDGENCSASMEFEWPEIIMESVVPSSPSDDDMNWYMEYSFNDQFDVMVEHGDFSDYSDQIYINSGVALEDQGFSSLWQESNDTQ